MVLDLVGKRICLWRKQLGSTSGLLLSRRYLNRQQARQLGHTCSNSLPTIYFRRRVFLNSALIFASHPLDPLPTRHAISNFIVCLNAQLLTSLAASFVRHHITQPYFPLILGA